MRDTLLLKKMAIAVLVFAMAVFGYPLNGQAQSAEQELWNIQRDDTPNSLRSTLAFKGGLHKLEEGDYLQLRTPSAELVSILLTKVQPTHLGGVLLQGYSKNNQNQLHLVVANGRGFGQWTINGETSYMIHSEALKPTALITANSITLLPAKLEIETLLSSALTLNSGPVVAWFTSDFEEKYGLSTSLRLQYVVSRINQLRKNNNLDPVTLIHPGREGKAGRSSIRDGYAPSRIRLRLRRDHLRPALPSRPGWHSRRGNALRGFHKPFARAF